MYQSSRLPSKKYRALPWCLNTAVNVTNLKNRHQEPHYVFSVLSSHLFWTSSSLDVPAGVTKEEGHTGFFIHLPSAVRALIFLARRIQPSLSLACRPSSRILCTNDLIVLLSLGIFILFLVRKIPFTDIELTSQRVRRSRGYL